MLLQPQVDAAVGLAVGASTALHRQPTSAEGLFVGELMWGMAHIGDVRRVQDLTEWIAMGLHSFTERLASLGGHGRGGDFVGFVIPAYVDTHSR